MAIRLAVLVSGNGTTLQNLLDRIADGRLSASIELVIASRPDAQALERARPKGVATLVLPKATIDERSRLAFDACRARRVDLVVMAGFLIRLHIPNDFRERVLNIHPSLIPSFCGKGYYGSKVHQAVLDRGVKISGCTVHFADDQYDHGPIVAQRGVEVRDDDTAELLAARVFREECELLPAAITWFAQGRIRIEGSRARVLSDDAMKA